jgi:hypothetical protein
MTGEEFMELYLGSTELRQYRGGYCDERVY